MHSVDDRILATWQVDNLEAILGPDLSPSTWSQHLRKRLLALSRLVSLQQARDLLRQELSSRLNDPARNRGVQRKHLCDIDVLHVVNAQQQKQPRMEPLEQYEQPAPDTVTPVSTRSTRRKRILPESPDPGDARPSLPSRSPDLSARFTLSRPPPSHPVRDDYPLQLLARTAANHQTSYVPILPRTYRPMRPPVTYRPSPPTVDYGNQTDTIVVDPNSPESTPRSQSAQSRDTATIPPPDDPSPLPTPETNEADDMANDDVVNDDMADGNMADDDMADDKLANNDMASDDVANQGMANGDNYTDTVMVDPVLAQDVPRPVQDTPRPFQDTPRPQTTTPSAPKDRIANPRVDTVFARLRNERELEIADLEGEVQKLRFEVNVKRTQVQLYRHNHMQARRRAERARGSLDDLATEEEVAGQVGEYDKALAEIKAIGERYSSIFDAQDEENPGDQRRQTPRTPAHRNMSQTSSLGTPGVQDVGGTPKVLLSSLHAAIKMQKAQRVEMKSAAQEARAAAEQSVKDAEAAVAERLAEADDAEASIANLLGSLESLEKYLNSVKEQALLLNKMGAC